MGANSEGNIMKKFVVLFVLAALLGSSGCASIAVNQALQHKHNAVQAAAVNGGAGVGVSIFDLGAITSWSDFLLQTGGAVIDAGLVWGACKIYENNQTPSTPVTPTAQAGDHSTIVIINGNPGNSSVPATWGNQ